VTPLILASTSAYRRELLARFGLPFRAESPGVDEQHQPDEAPAARAIRLALAKAQAVAKRFPEAVVIGSDQVAAAGDRILDKPGNAAVCSDQLAHLSGSTAFFYTACAVVGPGASTPATHLDTTSVYFRKLSRSEIARYIEREQPFDCAGGFKAEALGITLFERVTSDDPTALIGLPLIWLAGALRAAGYTLP
jgi:septum formation protein